MYSNEEQEKLLRTINEGITNPTLLVEVLKKYSYNSAKYFRHLLWYMIDEGKVIVSKDRLIVVKK